MAHDPKDDEVEELSALPPEQLSDEMARDIAKRWDPERLLKLVAARAGKGEALDAHLRHRYEQKLGVDLGHVRIYSGEFAEEFNRQRNADAVTIGGTGMILMGGNADRSMATSAGHGLLAHELTHVAQAERGMYRAGRGEDMVLASDANEEEAHAAEHEEEEAQKGAAGSSQTGGAKGPGDNKTKADKKEKLRQQLVDRVMEMLGEWGRVEIMRGGEPNRRP